jgi:hypothetical protein
MRGSFAKTERNAPIGLDRHRVYAAPVAGQRVKPKQGQCHVFRPVRRFQRREDLFFSYSRRKPVCLGIDRAVTYS